MYLNLSALCMKCWHVCHVFSAGDLRAASACCFTHAPFSVAYSARAYRDTNFFRSGWGWVRFTNSTAADTSTHIHMNTNNNNNNNHTHTHMNHFWFLTLTASFSLADRRTNGMAIGRQPMTFNWLSGTAAFNIRLDRRSANSRTWWEI